MGLQGYSGGVWVLEILGLTGFLRLVPTHWTGALLKIVFCTCTLAMATEFTREQREAGFIRFCRAYPPKASSVFNLSPHPPLLSQQPLLLTFSPSSLLYSPPPPPLSPFMLLVPSLVFIAPLWAFTLCLIQSTSFSIIFSSCWGSQQAAIIEHLCEHPGYFVDSNNWAGLAIFQYFYFV